MTPDVESGEFSLENKAQELGFDNVDAMLAAAKKSKARDAYDGREQRRVRELEAEIAELRAKKQEADLGIGDDADETSRRLARELLDVKSTLSALTTKILSSPEDEELEPYMQKVLTDYPEVKTVKDPARRIDMARRLARQLKSESDGPDTKKGDRDISGTHLTGGDVPVTRRSQIDEDKAMARYRSELAQVKSYDKEKVHAKYRAKYPHWGI